MFRRILTTVCVGVFLFSAVTAFGVDPTRFTNGVSTQSTAHPFGDLPIPDTFDLVVFDEDFAAGGVIGAATDAGTEIALFVHDVTTSAGTTHCDTLDRAGGILCVTGGTSDNDSVALFLGKYSSSDLVGTDSTLALYEPFAFTSGKELWFKARIQAYDSTQSDWFMGLGIKTTELQCFAANPSTYALNGVMFYKKDGADDIDFVVGNGTSITTNADASDDTADATYVEVAFHYDGSELHYYIDDAHVAQSVVTYLPSAELTVVFGVVNGAGTTADCILVDRITVIAER